MMKVASFPLSLQKIILFERTRAHFPAETTDTRQEEGTMFFSYFNDFWAEILVIVFSNFMLSEIYSRVLVDWKV